MKTKMASSVSNSSESETTKQMIVIKPGQNGSPDKHIKITLKIQNTKATKAKPSASATPSPSAGDRERSRRRNNMVQSNSTAERVWKCHKCHVTFVAKSTYYYHMNKHKVLDGTGKLKCSKCDEHFVSRRDLKSHLKRHNNGKKFWCKDCKKSLASEGFYKRHMRSHSEPKKGCFKCHMCSKVFCSRKNLQRHKVVIHAERHLDSFLPQICPMCPLGFLTKVSFMAHLSRHFKQEDLALEQAATKKAAEKEKVRVANIKSEVDIKIEQISEFMEEDNIMESHMMGIGEPEKELCLSEQAQVPPSPCSAVLPVTAEERDVSQSASQYNDNNDGEETSLEMASIIVPNEIQSHDYDTTAESTILCDETPVVQEESLLPPETCEYERMEVNLTADHPLDMSHYDTDTAILVPSNVCESELVLPPEEDSTFEHDDDDEYEEMVAKLSANVVNKLPDHVNESLVPFVIPENVVEHIKTNFSVHTDQNLTHIEPNVNNDICQENLVNDTNQIEIINKDQIANPCDDTTLEVEAERLKGMINQLSLHGITRLILILNNDIPPYPDFSGIV